MVAEAFKLVSMLFSLCWHLAQPPVVGDINECFTLAFSLKRRHYDHTIRTSLKLKSGLGSLLIPLLFIVSMSFKQNKQKNLVLK